MSVGPRQSRRRPSAVFAAPIAIAAASLAGLIAALTGDGLRDVLSWILLAVPVAVAGWAMRRRSR